MPASSSLAGRDGPLMWGGCQKIWPSRSCARQTGDDGADLGERLPGGRLDVQVARGMHPHRGPRPRSTVDHHLVDPPFPPPFVLRVEQSSDGVEVLDGVLRLAQAACRRSGVYSGARRSPEISLSLWTAQACPHSCH
jgi:hypothetical protein